MVSAGAASGLTLGTAACVTGGNAEAIRQLTDTTGLKNEVAIQGELGVWMLQPGEEEIVANRIHAVLKGTV